MKYFLLFSIGLFIGVQAISYSDVVLEQWQAFKLRYGKNYLNPVEDRMRMKVFMENSRLIARHNQEYNRGLKSFELKVSKFADKFLDEYIRTYNGYNNTFKRNSAFRSLAMPFVRPAHVELPKEVDWRKDGAVTPVKDQGECGSCYTFSATGALEGQLFRSTKKLVSLSEQNILDCSTDFGNQGCDGGMVESAFLYVNLNKGLDSETSYPYKGESKDCNYEQDNSQVTDSGYVQVDTGDEEALKEAVAMVGPIAVAIDADHSSFQHYSEGIYYEPECSSEKLSHAVLIVGYGTDKSEEGNEKDYWLVKNSWGEEWGNNGYIKMARNRKNNCGIATEASFPVVFKKKHNNTI